MEPFIYKGYTITPNVHLAEAVPGKWVFEAATITDSDGNEVYVAAPASERPPLFDTGDAAARVCISQAKALIEAGDIG
ncbi:MAG: hypothetical protein EA382_02745 [Spirochaetaceae bacterium]|nr:MAG: hypothetical protein EA382_02745 [Spirochaetaceae bacterium]